MTAVATIADAIVEIEKTIRERERYYQSQIERGRRPMKPETMEQKQGALRHAQTLLTWLERNMDWIKPEAQRRARTSAPSGRLPARPEEAKAGRAGSCAFGAGGESEGADDEEVAA